MRLSRPGLSGAISGPVSVGRPVWRKGFAYVKLTVLDLSRSGAAYSGAAIYLWHCDPGASIQCMAVGFNENYLRGVQEADANGVLTFQTIFPAAYSGDGRISTSRFTKRFKRDAAPTKLRPHSSRCQKTSAVPLCHSGYEASVRNLASTSIDRDMVFSDGYGHSDGCVTGDVNSGYTASYGAGLNRTVKVLGAARSFILRQDVWPQDELPTPRWATSMFTKSDCPYEVGRMPCGV